MKTYAVTILGQGQWTIDIEAESEEKANQIALFEFVKEPERLQEVELVVDEVEEQGN
jgi:hypothetical protein